jgi:predicted O-methyltransferase YrrM
MTTYDDELSRYITALFAHEDDILRQVWQSARDQGMPAINIKPEEGRFLQLLARASGARKAVEIGTLGGYSGIWIGRGLLPSGKLITLERERHRAQIARKHFSLAGLSDTIEVRVGNAHNLLNALKSEAPFDFVFIDADKAGYVSYFEWALDSLRAGGIISAHNAFRGGSVVTGSESDENTTAIQQFNRRVADEPRVISTIYPAGDGILIAVKTQ